MLTYYNEIKEFIFSFHKYFNVKCRGVSGKNKFNYNYMDKGKFII